MPEATIRTYVQWRCTAATKFRFMELINEYEQVEEDSDEAEVIREGIESLPGFPSQAPIGSDFIIEVTSVMH